MITERNLDSSYVPGTSRITQSRTQTDRQIDNNNGDDDNNNNYPRC